MIEGVLGAMHTVLYMAGYLELAEVALVYWGCCQQFVIGLKGIDNLG